MMGHSLTNELDLNDIVRELLPLIDAKGGGSPSIVQGTGNNSAGIVDFIDQLKQKLERIRISNE
jgi:alanyl-tRNA synthetase